MAFLFFRRVGATTAATFMLVVSGPAWALQPLESFVRQARLGHPSVRETVAVSRQQRAESDISRAALLPSLALRGLSTRNQYDVSFTLPVGDDPTTIVIQPKNQLDAFFTLTVPLVDLGAWGRYRAARASVEVGQANQEILGLGLEGQVATAYYRLVGSDALRAAAERAVTAAEANASLVRDRRSAGAASDLDMARADADVARARQDATEAALGTTLAHRSLRTLSGLDPEPVTPMREESLDEEAPLESWLAGLPDLPTTRAALASERAADEARRAAVWSLLPTFALRAEERLTNARSFVGRNAFYTVTFDLSWSIDTAAAARVEAQRAAAEQVSARAEQSRRAAADQIFEAWHRAQAAVGKVRSARAQSLAADRAAQLARDRYAAGAVTQLEVVQAQRDAFAAQAARVQADADLALARAQLRLSAGHSLRANRAITP